MFSINIMGQYSVQAVQTQAITPHVTDVLIIFLFTKYQEDQVALQLLKGGWQMRFASVKSFTYPVSICCCFPGIMFSP